MNPPFHLEITAQLRLQLLTEADAAPLATLVQRNYDTLHPWIAWLAEVTTERAALRYIRAALRLHRRGQVLSTGIWYDDALIGMISLNQIHATAKTAEMGYWLDADMQGQGIITQCAQALTTYSFHTLKLQQVEIHCQQENLKSQAVAQRLGYTFKNTYSELCWKTGTYINTIVYSMNATDWPTHHQKP